MGVQIKPTFGKWKLKGHNRHNRQHSGQMSQNYKTEKTKEKQPVRPAEVVKYNVTKMV